MTETVTLSYDKYNKLEAKAAKNYYSVENSKNKKRVEQLEKDFKYLGILNREKIERIDELERKFIMRIPVFLIGLVIGFLVNIFIF